MLQICLKRAANQKLRHALGDDQDAYDVQVVCPVAKEIARRLKITGFMNYTTNTHMIHFKAAVRTLLSALNQRGVNLELAEMKDVQRDTLINTIARETQRYFIPKPHCCTNTLAFFKAQLTPRQLEEAAPTIAEVVAKAWISSLEGGKLPPSLRREEAASCSLNCAQPPALAGMIWRRTKRLPE